jgi:hypothetical protein
VINFPATGETRARRHVMLPNRLGWVLWASCGLATVAACNGAVDIGDHPEGDANTGSSNEVESSVPAPDFCSIESRCAQ